MTKPSNTHAPPKPVASSYVAPEQWQRMSEIAAERGLHLDDDWEAVEAIYEAEQEDEGRGN